MASISARDVCRRALRGRLGQATRTTGPARLGTATASIVHRQPFSQTTKRSHAPHADVEKAAGIPVSLRKQLKEEAKARKASGQPKKAARQGQTVPGWELTVGIEIHAQLNTACKLFSAAAMAGDAPNTHVAYFDASLPGAQPIFQAATLVPAIRAALALGCTIQPVSRFDRKHYFHWDQPSGYQITQYYAPFARHGSIVLYARDGIAPEDGDHVSIAIQQVQMEQDTAKTLAQPGGAHWLDFNRVGAPLVEIITAPQLHHPATAAALVRKIQQLLAAVDACTTGMEEGGLRADVNVSVRRTDTNDTKLGTRTEIKNLNSFRAVEDAIIAERNRQIAAMESGHGDSIVSETRGWTPSTSASSGGGETHRLRGKEGEVDYRYMPDPDLGPVVIDDALVEYLRRTSGTLPDAELTDLVQHYGLSTKDAMALMQLNGGGRAQYYYDVVDAFEARLGIRVSVDVPTSDATATATAGRSFVANWVLHQLGRLTSERNSSLGEANDLDMTPDGRCRIPVAALADILVFRYQGRITAGVAKDLLFAVFRGEIGDDKNQSPSVEAAIEQGRLWFDEISPEEYRELAAQALAGEDKTLQLFVAPKRYPQGKLQYLMGKLLRLGPEGRTDPLHAEAAVRAAIEEYVQQRREKGETK